ncbi:MULTISPECIES: non-ribosomal peptide synthetase [Bacillus]|uniref:Non-ribosomal peptide synthetase n=1 Tax=Bacillus glycinifermentans TaxID=1664069 RepID=A0AAJ3YZX7_9BACI|nr:MULTISPECIES: non-ribosomal peptide synthetase [Bacillus]KKB72066.1 ornithine racemase [Bacillus sp. TH008]MDU0073344.1 non-ribosomal peptide synthetase [Bacillus sp. IG6]MED8021737.1 non-ribosomal peptide synthetase [Bacillus glycinifermentans]QAT65943.1 non-ribosomal peptide synthetase [Bacillus glycinifermentans]WKB75644.1 non-ribosomal peptide synthetase [Bacillus glycinifermentans]
MSIIDFINDLKKKHIFLYHNQGKIRIIGPQELLTPELKQKIKQHKEEIIAALKIDGTKKECGIPEAPLSKNGCYPLSREQKRMFILNKLDESGMAYNMPLAVKIRGDFQISRLEHAWRQLIGRHEALRTSFETVNGEPVQKIEPDVDFHLRYSELGTESVQEKIARFIKPFRLEKAPLLRAEIVKVNEAEHMMMVDMHHIISDGVSIGILMKELADVCGGKPLSPAVTQYKDYSEWQRETEKKGGLKKQEDYWLNVFQGEIPVLNMPLDFARPKNRSFDGGRAVFELDHAMTGKLESLAAENGVTMYMLLLTVYTILLSKYTGQEDIIVGSPIAGRSHADLKHTVGMFVNTLAMRNYPKGDMTFTEYLKEVKEHTLNAYENQDYQFDALVDKLDLIKDTSRNPLFDTMFDLQNAEDFKFDAGGVFFEPYSFPFDVSKFDVSLTAVHHGDRIELDFQYCTKLFKKETIKRMASHFLHLLQDAAYHPERTLCELSMMSEEEKHTVLHIFNHEKTDYPKHQTINGLFEDRAEKTPDHTAVICGDEHLTYRELNEKSNQLARLLRKNGVKPDTVVGIMTDRSLEMIIGIIGILKAGGAYLPIDPDYPADRMMYMLKDSGVDAVFTQEHLKSKAEGFQLITVEDTGSFSKENLPHVNDAADLAYVIYTSGSSGRPKGVMTTHRNVINYIHSFTKRVPLHENDTVLQVVSFSFDAFSEELYPILASSGRLVISKKIGDASIDELVENINKHRVTLVSCSPLLLNEIDKNKHLAFHQNMKFISGGDVLKYEYVENIIKGADVYNSYGPTEATVCATYYKLSGEDRARTSIPIGRPLSNYKVYVADRYGRPQPVGIPGELLIGGDGLARGYVNNKKLTDAAFILDASGERLYRTGDLARWLPDGNLEFLGRIDQQVKIRGYRIELEEIEHRLLENGDINEAIVMAREDSGKNKYLCAYITLKNKGATIDQIKRSLAKNLPDYMVPSHFVKLDKVPRTINGKADVKSLPEPDARDLAQAQYEAPRNQTEEKLLSIWQEVLGTERIGINDNFFEIGGHSLKAFSLAANIQKELNAEVTLKEMFSHPTIKEIAAYIKQKHQTVHSAIKQAEKKAYYALSSAQKRLYILNQIEDSQTAYNMPFAMKLKGRLRKEKLEKAFKALIDRHEGFRTSFVTVDGEPVQKIEEEVNFEITSAELGKQSLQERMNRFIKPFDLEEAPLLRAELLKVNEDEHILLIDMHHIISDGMSMGIFMKEWAALYEEKPLPPLKIQYKDYSEWQRESYEKDRIKKQEEYWLHTFQDDIPVLNMPTDYPRPQMQSFEGDRFAFKIGGELTGKLKTIAKENGVTMYMLLLAGYTVLLSKYTGQEDVIVGSPIAGRTHEDVENTIGMFVNTLAMRNYPKGGSRFIEYLKEVKEHTLNAYENQDYPFDELVDKLDLERDISRNALFDTMFDMQSLDDAEPQIEGLDVETCSMEFHISKFDLSLAAAETADGIAFHLEYCTRLFKKETAETLAGHFIHILKDISDHPEKTLNEINMLSEEERNAVLYHFNDTKTGHPTGILPKLFEEQAEKTPNLPAAVFKDQTLTYGELNEKANQLAKTLRKKGVRRESIVGMMAERSLDMVTGVLAILKAGGAYLPIDPEYPKERIEYMLKDSGADILLIQDHLIGSISFAGEIVNMSSPDAYASDRSNLEHINSSGDLAYVIYTSGTTGNPKGVMVEHGNLIHAHYNWRRHYELETFKVNLLQLASFSFDVFAGDLCRSLFNGGTMYIVPNDVKLEMNLLYEMIKKYHINIFESTPSFVIPFMKYIHHQHLDISGMKLLVMGSDSCAIKDYKWLVEQYGNSMRIINSYGVTEASVDSSYYEEDLENIPDIANTPIGKPLDNTAFYILDSSLNPQPVGVYGELYIGGGGIARGYCNNPELSKERFVPNRFDDGGNMYKTGDLARWLPDGNVEFLGRIDHQVKIRGFRIEISEIESRLLGKQDISEAVIIDREDGKGHKYLCAYIVAQKSVNANELREYLSNHLPDYMIPSYFVQISRMPLTPNGKVDRKALPEPDEERAAASEYEAPRNDTEEKLAAVWQEVLDRDKIGINDNFFEVGGDSIKALQIVSKLSRADLKLQVKDLFTNPVIKHLSKYVKKEAKARQNNEIVQGEAPLTPIQRAFFEANKIEQNHYNQAFMLYRENGFDEKTVEKVFRKLVEQHDALRMIYKEKNGEIIQHNRGLEDSVFDLYVYDMKTETNLEEIVYQTATAVQKEISIRAGSMMKLAIFKTNSGDHLLIAIHHLVVDGVSWRILFEDFETAYSQALQGKTIELGYKTDSYKTYAEKLAEYAQTKKLFKERDYWRDISKGTMAFLPKQRRAEDNYENSNTLRVFLSETETEQLLGEVHKAYNTQINDILLTALLITARKMTGENKLKILMEGHGREDILQDVDISRTVGWFTSIYPVFIDLEDETELSMTIKMVKETLRKIPNNGIGYGILKFLSKDEELLKDERPPILFNYLGEIEHDTGAGQFSSSELPKGQSIGEKSARDAAVEIDSVVANQRLIISTTFNRREYGDHTIRDFNQTYKESLQTVINHCMSKHETEKTSSDYGYDKISLQDLEELLNEYESVDS